MIAEGDLNMHDNAFQTIANSNETCVLPCIPVGDPAMFQQRKVVPEAIKLYRGDT